MAGTDLIFLLGAPRSGTTLLQRMLASHPAIHTLPEPHLLTPLYHLGYYAHVEQAPYDPINAAQAQREFVAALPGGEADYVAALRAYCDTLYGRALAASNKRLFVDKTPAYGLIAPFVARLYPQARFIVLCRHPMAILHSQAHSFFLGDYAAAQAANPLVERYVPALAAFLRDASVAKVHVRYEDLVQDPETHMRRLLAFVGVDWDARVIEYGAQAHVVGSFGDPTTVNRQRRPVADSVDAWAADLLARPEAMALARQVANHLTDEDLETWGYRRAELWDAATRTTARPTRRRWDGYRVRRHVLLQLRRNVQKTALGATLRKVRYFCDVVLR